MEVASGAENRADNFLTNNKVGKNRGASEGLRDNAGSGQMVFETIIIVYNFYERNNITNIITNCSQII